MFRFEYHKANHKQFPIGSFLLMGLFYLIGILTYKEGALSDFGSNLFAIHIIDRSTYEQYTIVPEFQWQWQIFTYGYVHFALVHYAYVGTLIFYYVQGLERATSAKFVFFGFFILSAICPIAIGLLYFPIANNLPATKDWILSNSFYLGSSAGVWGLIGLSVTSGYKRTLYWFGIFTLLVIEFFLKIRVHDDVTSNVTHILIFLAMWGFAKVFLHINPNEKKIGGLKITNKVDLFLAFLVSLHALGMVFYFTYKLGYT